MDRIITVKGTGKASVAPDYILIYLGVFGQKKEYNDAVDCANDKLEKLQMAVIASGFDKDSLKTSNFRVDTVYENVRDEKGEYHQQFSGYKCHYDVKLGFDFDKALLGKVLSEIANCGAGPELNIQFTVKNVEAVRKELLEYAAENATEKAKALCNASGVKLGVLVGIDYGWSEQSFVSPTRYDVTNATMPLMAKRAAASFTPEDIQVGDSAVFRWEID